MILQGERFQHSDITSKILKAFFNVYNKLGYGFLEKVYENSLLIELKKQGLDCKKQVTLDVFYDEFKVGLYYADIIVNDCVIIELKAADGIVEEHEAQLINYLRATKIEVGLLLNFGKQAQYKRKAYSNTFKNQQKDPDLS
jgi:GxxExxY protein